MQPYKVSFRNRIHNTEVTLIPKRHGGRYYLNRRQYNRMRRELCGIKDCKCSYELIPWAYNRCEESVAMCNEWPQQQDTLVMELWYEEV